MQMEKAIANLVNRDLDLTVFKSLNTNSTRHNSGSMALQPSVKFKKFLNNDSLKEVGVNHISGSKIAATQKDRSPVEKLIDMSPRIDTIINKNKSSVIKKRMSIEKDGGFTYHNKTMRVEEVNSKKLEKRTDPASTTYLEREIKNVIQQSSAPSERTRKVDHQKVDEVIIDEE